MKIDNIFVIRHGQSEGNVDRAAYSSTPDYAIQLTKAGKEQAYLAGKKLANITNNRPVLFYVSPFWRARQTFIEIAKSFSDWEYVEDVRLREQEWGTRLAKNSSVHKQLELERDAYGSFYYRFDNGESCADVNDRLIPFITDLRNLSTYCSNVIIITHGMTMRLFIKVWYNASVEEFETWKNPRNCEYYHMVKTESNIAENEFAMLTPVKTRFLPPAYVFKWPTVLSQRVNTQRVPTILGAKKNVA